jgi:hypothetical protein
MKVVTWHDGHEPYVLLSALLARSAAQFDLPVTVMPFAPAASVAAAQEMRLTVVDAALTQFPGEELLVLDADCVFHKPPKLLEGVPGMMALPFFKGTWYSGVWFLRPSVGVTSFLAAMRRIWAAHPLRVERDILNAAVAELLEKATAFSVSKLPPAYWWIEPFHRRKFPHGRPVIEHYCVNMGGEKTLRKRGIWSVATGTKLEVRA